MRAMHSPSERTTRPAEAKRSRVRPDLRRVVRVGLLLLVAGAWAPAWAQTFSFDRYYLECLGFEAGGDLTTARQSCLNALEVDEQRVEAQLALGRIEFALGELAAAETRLTRVRPRIESAEADVLLAEITLAASRVDEAESYVASARGKLTQRPDADLEARLAYVEGRTAEARRDPDAALAAYERAIAADALSVHYRLVDADLRWRLGDLAGAAQQLRDYEIVTADVRNPEVMSLLGRVSWVQGLADEAIGQIETALALRDLRDSEGQAADLRVLATLYYGQGDLQRGGLALREATRRGNLLASLDGNSILWLLALVVLLALHLIGESRQAGLVAPPAEGPRTWSLGEAYGLLVAAVLVGFAATLAYGLAVHDNLAVLLTPHQQHEARAVYLIAFGAVTAAASAWRVRRLGWNPGERLVGRSDGLVAGLVVGALLYAVILGYLMYRPEGGLTGPFFLDLAWLTPLRVVALTVVPLSEFYFRGFLRPAVEARYGRMLALPLMTLVWALAFATPIVVLVPIGFALAEIDRRRPNGLTAVTAVWVAWVGLAATVAVSPFVRSLFL
jgi:tetratricopeptide (TPR) repeat protein